MGQGHRGQLHRVKGALIELQMAEVLQKREIVPVRKISAQSEQLSHCELDPDGLDLCYTLS